MSGVLERLVRGRAMVAVLVVAPVLWPLWPFFVTRDASVLADPPKYLLHHYGFTAVIVLAAVLALTPLRVLFPRSRLAQAVQRHRRFIGVGAFAHAVLHVVMHLIYEGGFGTLATDWSKLFIVAGLAAFAILALLAFTSLRVAVRALGARWWKGIHRLVYLAAALAAGHQIAAHKVFPVQVLWIFVPVIVLEGGRVAAIWMRRRALVAGAPIRGNTPGGGR